MSIEYAEIFAALAAPFEREEVKVRTLAGRQIHYVTARTIQNRLDNVLGPAAWWDDYDHPTENSVICRLSIRLPDGRVLTKCDAGGAAGMADAGDDDKSMFSDAFKRAAVKFGPSRYLYRDGVPNFAHGAFADGSGVKAEPETPAEQQASSQSHRPLGPTDPPKPQRHQGGGGAGNGHNGPPRTGKALFAWTKDQEQKHEVSLLKYLNSWAKLQDFPGRMVDWDAEQVALAYAEAVRKLHSIATADDAGEPDAGTHG